MSGRYHLYSVCTILAMGSLSASDLNLEIQGEGEIAALTSPKKIEASIQKCPKAEECIPKSSNTTAPMLYLQPCPDAWRFSADFLYYMPTVDDTYFAVNSPIVGNFTLLGTRSNNNFGFNPGFRVGAEYAFCQTRRDIQVFYTYLHAEQTKLISGNDLWATVGSVSFAIPFTDRAGSATSKLKSLYQRLDFNVSQHIIDAHGFNLYVQPGFEYAYLRLQQSYRFDVPGDDGILGTVQQQSRGWGIGPQLGLGFDANLYQGSIDSKRSIAHAVTVSSLFSSSILTGQGRTQELDTRTEDGIISVTNDQRDELAWRVIPAMHARVGLAYLVHNCSMGASLSIGYEFNTYIRALAKTLFPSSNSTSNCITNYYNFDVQGLDISVAFTF